MIAKRSLRGRSPSFSRGVRGHAPPENFEIRDCQIRIFNVLVSDSTHLLQEKVGLIGDSHDGQIFDGHGHVQDNRSQS